MFVLIVELKAAAGMHEKLAELLRKLVATAQTEEGIHLYAVQQDQQEASHFVLSEFYADQPAWQAHLSHPVVEACLAEFEALLREPPRIIRCDALALTAWRD